MISDCTRYEYIIGAIIFFVHYGSVIAYVLLLYGMQWVDCCELCCCGAIIAFSVLLWFHSCVLWVVVVPFLVLLDYCGSMAV